LAEEGKLAKRGLIKKLIKTEEIANKYNAKD